MESAVSAVERSCWRLRETSRLVLLQHTVFALPFAVIGLVTAAGDGWPALTTWWWVAVAMVAARTAAMAFNRLADHHIDAANPRTAGRALPAGTLSRSYVASVTVGSSLLFILAAGMLNPVCLALAVPTLAVLLGYSYAKRFTTLSHLWLGCSLGLAPMGAWIAEAARLEALPVLLGIAVSLWVTGFDIIYSLQDEAFDREHGLFSAPARLGARRALVVARLAHGGALTAFVGVAHLAGGGALRFLAAGAAGALLVCQHRLVSATDHRRVNAAFFTTNGVLAVIMCVLFLFAKMRVAP